MRLINYLLNCSQTKLWLIFFLENISITFLTIIIGYLVIKNKGQKTVQITKKEWLICVITNMINTAITYLGFWLWLHQYIQIKTEINLHIIIDFLILFFAMDILMYGLHYIIHHSFLYKSIHYYHHTSIDPTPIDLFILHPLETFAFGGLWLTLLWCYPFNLFGISLYLIVNVVFGMIGHLGIQSKSRSKKTLTKYLGTSSFHHNHHKYINHNYGFYTNIWDRLLNTYRDR